MGLGHFQPAPVGLEPPLEHEGRLLLLVGDQPDHVFVETAGQGICLDVGDEAVLVFPVDQVFDWRTHGDSSVCSRSLTSSVSTEAGNRTLYSHAVQPRRMWASR